MEEKIYDRQVTKQSLSFRVVDQQQIERHFTTNELAELYTFEPDTLDDPSGKKSKKATPLLPKVNVQMCTWCSDMHLHWTKLIFVTFIENLSYLNSLVNH